MKKNVLKKYSNLIICFAIIIILIVLIIFVYKNLFESNSSNRLENIENYKLTSNEINKVKEKINELEDIDSIDIYTNYKIIKIFVTLKEDIEFKALKKKSDECIELISEDNLGYYDLEIFIDSLDKNSKTYPKIGYKYKTSSSFVWNR